MNFFGGEGGQTVNKIIKRAFIVIAILLFITVFCFDNIKRNSVYYAKHTPHKEGTEPVLMMLIDNLDWIYNPELEGIEYDFDGGHVIYNNNYKSEDVPWFASHDGEEYHYGSNGYKSYSLVDVRIKCENENTQNSITVANKRI